MNLNRLSNEELLLKTKKIVGDEREILLAVLQHLKEIEARRLYLKIGFSSLWDYCTKELGYSESSAQRRIEAMRAIRDLPVLEQKIESGVLTLSNVAKVQSTLRRHRQTNLSLAKEAGIQKPQFFSVTDKLEIFSQIENKSQKETDHILTAQFPDLVKHNDKLRRVNGKETEIRYLASNDLIEKLEKIKSLFSHKNANPNQAELIELMADFVIARKDPTAKAARASSKSDTKAESLSKTIEEAPVEQSLPPHGRQTTRYIPTRTRSQVWHDADGRCEFVDTRTHRRCDSRHRLEIDHVQPFAFGGSHQRNNLRLYCRAHNVLAARDATLMGG